MFRKVALATLAVVVLSITGAVMSAWKAFGTNPEGARQERIVESPQWDGDGFTSGFPTLNIDVVGMIQGRMNRSDHTSPRSTPPVIERDAASFPAVDGLRVTWLGHSSMFVEIDGVRLLIDPVWGPRSSPVTWAGPKRFHPPVLPLEDLPPADAVLISHDHYDHLDYPTIGQLAPTGVKFVVPLGIGAHLEYWGVASDNIVELDWWEEHVVDGVRLVSTPSRHFSGRGPAMSNRTLWTGWAMLGPNHRAYYSGDTAMFPGFVEVGERLGPFDVTMIESGAYSQLWPDVHLGPEQAVAAHRMAKGKLMIPVHWGTFDLANHGWTEPAERVLAESIRLGVTVATPKIGQSIDLPSVGETNRWWPDLPWSPASESPVVSTAIGDLLSDYDK